jgi:hypothetical protein
MQRLLSLGHFLSFAILLISYNVTAIVLRELPHAPEARSIISRFNRRSADFSTLNLKSAESFTWGGAFQPIWTSIVANLLTPSAVSQSYHAVVANLTVYTPDFQENIISLQRFKSLLQSVNCTQESIDLKFKDDAALQHAKTTWDWVNTAENYTFILVADTRDCGWNDHRMPFIVSELRFNEKENAAHLAAKASTWQNATHTYTLQVGSLENPSSKLRRQLGGENINRELSVGFDYKLPVRAAEFIAPFYDYKLGVKMDCDDCGTQGRFDMALHLEHMFGVPTKVQASMRPRGVGARMAPRLTVIANFTRAPRSLLERDWPPLPLDGVSIPGGVLSIEPELLFNAGVEFGPLVGSGSLSGGTMVSLEDSEHVTLDLLGAFPYTQSKWAPTIRPRSLILDSKMTGDLRMYAKGRLHINAKSLGQEYDIGISLTPSVTASIEGIACTYSILTKTS